MDEYVPGQVYNNLIKMLDYRAVKLTGQQLTQDEVVQKLNHYEFITIPGRRGKDDLRGEATIMIILIAPGSKYSNKSGDFKKLLKGLPKIKEGESLEVMFVSEYELTIHIKKQLISYKLANPKIYLENYDYEIFLIETPKHVSVPKHVIMTPAEIKEMFDKQYTSSLNISKILQSDPQAVWLGLKPGMCVKIYRISETAGVAMGYRICVKG